MNKIILYIAISQDGFIADKNGDVDWLPQPKDDAELEAVGYKDLISRIDTILMGRNSYKQIMGFGDWGWPDKQTYVFTSKLLESKVAYIATTHDTPVEFISKIKERKSKKDLWLLGGAKLAKSFAQEGLIDEIILTIVPRILGDGMLLGLDINDFELSKEKLLTDGVVQKFYLRNRQK